MEATERCCKGKSKCCGYGCSICGPKFWNTFFHPRHHGVFLVLLSTICVIAFLVAYVYFALCFEAMSKHHGDAYLIMFVSNLLHLILGILVLHFLTVPPKKLTFLRAVGIYTGIIIAVALSSTAIILWNTTPTNGDIRRHVTKFFHSHNRVPRIYERLQQDNKCCGVRGFEDYVSTSGKKKGKVEILPDSCCRRRKEGCNPPHNCCGNFRGPLLNGSRTIEEIRKNVTHFYIQGCFSMSNSTYANLNRVSKTAYFETRLIINTVWISPILLLILIITFSYYTCYKLPRDEDGGPEWVQEEFKTKIRRSFQCFGPRIEDGNGVAGPRPDFARFHDLMNPNKDNVSAKESVAISSATSISPTGSASGQKRGSRQSGGRGSGQFGKPGRGSLSPSSVLGSSSSDDIEIGVDEHGHFVVTNTSDTNMQEARGSGEGKKKKNSKNTRWS